ncbi:MAG: VWA domain-containing protein, partial [Thermodesulfovibrionales bacterium]
MKTISHLVTLLIVCLTLAMPAAAGQSPSHDQDKRIVLLIDSSGSMKKTDPKSYRKPAAKLFVSLIGEEYKIAVLSFGDSR